MLGRLRAPCLMVLALLLTCVSPTSSRAAKGSFWLRWTATGDDGNTGRATRYEIRYSTSPITGGHVRMSHRSPQSAHLSS